MTNMGTGPANPPGRPRGSRNRAILNEEFIAAMLRHFRRDGERAIARMAATQPAAYCKILLLLVPREHKVEHSNPASSLTDEQLADMIADLEERIAQRADRAKLVEGQAAETAALPAPVEGIVSLVGCARVRRRSARPQRHAAHCTKHLQPNLGDRRSHDAPSGLCDQPAPAQAH